MHNLKEKDKLSHLFVDSSASPESGLSKARPYSRRGKSFCSFLPFVNPPESRDGSKSSNDRDTVQSLHTRWRSEGFMLYTDHFDINGKCSQTCRSEVLAKEHPLSKHRQIAGVLDDNDNPASGSSSYEFDEYRKTSDQTLRKPLHFLTNESTFITHNLYEFLQSSLPNIVKGCQWVLLYSTLKHGVSLRTLIRKSAQLSGPCLLIAGDIQGAVFGAMLECPLKPTPKRKYQGTNQTFVFTTIFGEPRIFRPTGANRYYYICLNDLLALGGGSNFALCLDGDLLKGTSGPCETFGNLCLSHSREFELKNVELWGFTHQSQYLA